MIPAEGDGTPGPPPAGAGGKGPQGLRVTGLRRCGRGRPLTFVPMRNDRRSDAFGLVQPAGLMRLDRPLADVAGAPVAPPHQETQAGDGCRDEEKERNHARSVTGAGKKARAGENQGTNQPARTLPVSSSDFRSLSTQAQPPPPASSSGDPATIVDVAGAPVSSCVTVSRHTPGCDFSSSMR